MNDQSTALTVQTPRDRGLAITGEAGGVHFGSMQQVIEFSQLMAKAEVAIPKFLRGNVGACLAVTMQAVEWQMTPFQVANKAYSVNDRLAFESQLMHAVILKRAPIKGRLKVEYSGDGATRKCRVWARLRDDVADEPGEIVDYESPMFKDIKVKNSPLWSSDTDQQFFYFASRGLCRRHFPDVLLGVYSRDEMLEAEPLRVSDNTDQARRLIQKLKASQEPAARGFNQEFVEKEISGGAAPAHDAQTGEITTITELDPDHVAKIFVEAVTVAEHGFAALDKWTRGLSEGDFTIFQEREPEFVAAAKAVDANRANKAEQAAISSQRAEADAAASRLQSETIAALAQQQSDVIDVAGLIENARGAAVQGRRHFDAWFLALEPALSDALKPEMPALMKMANAADKPARHYAEAAAEAKTEAGSASAEDPGDEDAEDWDATLAGFEAKVHTFTHVNDLNDYGGEVPKEEWYAKAPAEIRERAHNIFNNRIDELKKAPKKEAATKAAAKAQDADKGVGAQDGAEQTPDPLADIRKAGMAAAVMGVRKYKIWRGKLNQKQYDAVIAAGLDAELMDMARKADEAL